MKTEDVIYGNSNENPTLNEGCGDEEDDSKIFPQRLIAILSDELNQEAICWLPHGRAFIVRNRKLFAEIVMPRYFSRKAKFSSFTRKLNRWNFIRVSSGPELGAYHHEFFLRDRPHLAAQMFCKNARTMLAMAAPSSPSPVVALDTSVNLKNDPTEGDSASVRPFALNGNDNTTQKPAFSMLPTVTSQHQMIQNQANPMMETSTIANTMMGNQVMGSAFTPQYASRAQGQTQQNTTDQLNNVMALKRDHFIGMLGGQTPANVLEMLERQLQFVQRQREQDQANRLLIAMQMGQQQGAANKGSPHILNASQHDLQVLQLRQKLEASRLQQQKQQQMRPSNNRASAA